MGKRHEWQGQRLSQWQGHRLDVLSPGDRWLAPVRQVHPGADNESTGPLEPFYASEPHPAPATAPKHRSWRSAVALAVLGIGALTTIFVAGGSGKIAEPAPLAQAPGKLITSLTTAQNTQLNVKVGDYIALTLPAGRTYSTVVEQSDTAQPGVEDLKLPGQQPQLRADRPGHATVEVMSEPVCPAQASCPDRRILLGTLDISVTR